MHECVQSILSQDYPRIQLIISDDGSPDFDMDEISRFIESNKKGNIEGVFIHQMEKNGGTSKNFNFALSKAKGKYVKFIAADDLFYNDKALSTLVEAAERENSSVVVARAPNYDMYLERQEWIFPSDKDWNRMISAGQKDLFGIMSQYCLISAPSALYNRQFLVEQGGADETYPLIEDWPLWMKMIRMGKRFTFLNQSTVIYRSGGVSNSKENAAYAIHQIEYADVIRNECLPYKNMFASKKQYKNAKKSERQHRHDGIKLLDWKEYSFIQKLLFFLKYLGVYWDAGMEKVVRPAFWKLECLKRNIMICGVLLIALSIIINVHDIIKIIFREPFAEMISISTLNGLFGIGMLLFLMSIFLYILAIAIDFYNSIKYSIFK